MSAILIRPQCAELEQADHFVEPVFCVPEISTKCAPLFNIHGSPTVGINPPLEELHMRQRCVYRAWMSDTRGNDYLPMPHIHTFAILVNVLYFYYSVVKMSAMASQIPGVSIVCLSVCSGADQRKHQLKLRGAGLCEGSPPVTDGLPSQRASNAEIFSIWWRRHVSAFVCNNCQRKTQTIRITCSAKPIQYISQF